jgi:hypothetical protein
LPQSTTTGNSEPAPRNDHPRTTSARVDHEALKKGDKALRGLSLPLMLKRSKLYYKGSSFFMGFCSCYKGACIFFCVFGGGIHGKFVEMSLHCFCWVFGIGIGFSLLGFFVGFLIWDIFKELVKMFFFC